MNLKRSTTSMALILMTVSIISVTSIQNEAFAQTLGMSITAEAAKGSDTISVSGHTVSQFTDVTLRVTSPSGNNVVGIAQVTPDAMGDFAAQFKVGPTWTENGLYKITAKQGTSSLYTLTLRVEVNNGMTAETFVTQSNLDKGIVGGTTEVRSGLSITANAMEGSSTIGITGKTTKTNEDVTLTVTAPNGNVVSVNQISPSINGEFAKDITTGGPLWKQDGMYKVTAQQGKDTKFKDSVEVEIVDGVVIPEFGTIAALILAVAIISIVAVSAKSRLSIIPRY